MLIEQDDAGKTPTADSPTTFSVRRAGGRLAPLSPAGRGVGGEGVGRSRAPSLQCPSPPKRGRGGKKGLTPPARRAQDELLLLAEQLLDRALHSVGPDPVALGTEVQEVGHDVPGQRAVLFEELLADVTILD